MVIQKLNLCTGENMVISAVQGQGFQGCYPAPYCTMYIARALLSKIRNKILIGTLHFSLHVLPIFMFTPKSPIRTFIVSLIFSNGY